MRVLLYRAPLDRGRFAPERQTVFQSRGQRTVSWKGSFCLYANCPDEADELAANGGEGLLLGFSASQEPAVAQMQSMLGLPSDRLYRLALVALARREGTADHWTISIGPGCFDQDAP